MSRFTSIALLSLMVVAFLTPAQTRPSQADQVTTPKPKTCEANAHSVGQRGDESCILNCQNYLNAPLDCTKIIFYGSFCACDEGFIFRNGTDGGPCVKSENC